MDIALLIIRLLLAGIFALAGIAKFLDLKGSEKAFTDFGVPKSIALPSSVALSLAEIAIAVLLLITTTSWYAAIAASALLLLFIGQMAYQLSNGNSPDCHCFGQVHSEPVGIKSVIRNAVFAVPAIYLVSRGNLNQGLSFSQLSVEAILIVAMSAVLAAILAVVFYWVKKVSENQIQIMKRIEIMEVIAKEGGAVQRDEAGLPTEGLPIGAYFPDFSLLNVNAAAFSLATLLEKKKPVLFLFVSPTCNPCRALLPEIDKWHIKLANKIEIVLVSNGLAVDNIEKFGGMIPKTILLQKNREVAESVMAKWTPTAILMDAEGKVASRTAAGDSAIRELVEFIEKEDFSKPVHYFVNGNGNGHGHAHSHTLRIGEEVPQMEFQDIDGNSFDEKYFQGKPTLVTFWSTECPHCSRMMNDLREWDHKKGVDDPKLIVFSDGEVEEHRKIGLDSPIVLDKGYKLSTNFGMNGTPSAVLINEHGKFISETATGAPNIWALIGKKN